MIGRLKSTWVRCQRRGMPRASLLIAALTLTAGGICNVGAEAPTLAGKTVTMIIAAGAGDGGLNVWGRIVARHIGRNLPGNPTVVAQNMPGAGGFVAANHIYNVAPKAIVDRVVNAIK